MSIRVLTWVWVSPCIWVLSCGGCFFLNLRSFFQHLRRSSAKTISPSSSSHHLFVCTPPFTHWDCYFTGLAKCEETMGLSLLICATLMNPRFHLLPQRKPPRQPWHWKPEDDPHCNWKNRKKQDHPHCILDCKCLLFCITDYMIQNAFFSDFLVWNIKFKFWIM